MDQQTATTQNTQNILGEKIDLGTTRLADKLAGAVGLKLTSVVNNAIDVEAQRYGLTSPISGTLGEKQYQEPAKPCALCKLSLPVIAALALVAFLVLR